MVQENIEEVNKKAEKLENQYNGLKQEFKDYIETSKKNAGKKKSPKKVPPQITFEDLERMFNQIRKEMHL